jgi:hypothetical protein
MRNQGIKWNHPVILQLHKGHWGIILGIQGWVCVTYSYSSSACSYFYHHVPWSHYTGDKAQFPDLGHHLSGPLPITTMSSGTPGRSLDWDTNTSHTSAHSGRKDIRCGQEPLSQWSSLSRVTSWWVLFVRTHRDEWEGGYLERTKLKSTNARKQDYIPNPQCD